MSPSKRPRKSEVTPQRKTSKVVSNNNYTTVETVLSSGNKEQKLKIVCYRADKDQEDESNIKTKSKHERKLRDEDIFQLLDNDNEDAEQSDNSDASSTHSLSNVKETSSSCRSVSKNLEVNGNSPFRRSRRKAEKSTNLKSPRTKSASSVSNRERSRSSELSDINGHSNNVVIRRDTRNSTDEERKARIKELRKCNSEIKIKKRQEIEERLDRLRRKLRPPNKYMQFYNNSARKASPSRQETKASSAIASKLNKDGESKKEVS